MNYRDNQFMVEMGIVPCHLDDLFPGFLPEKTPEPDFIPPGNLREFLIRFPSGIREAVEAAAHHLGLALSYDELDDLAQDVILMLLEFAAADLEDVIGSYTLHPPMRRGDCRSVHFQNYVRLRVRCGVEALIEHELPSRRNWGHSIEL